MRGLLRYVCALGLLAGCSSPYVPGEGGVGDGSNNHGDGSVTDGSRTDGSIATCRSSSECTAPLVCINGRCTTGSGDGGTRFDAAADGTGADTGTCAIATGTPGRLPVDVIVMVDQSASTGEEAQAIQNNINTNLGNVLAASGLDYRVILINSDTGHLCPGAPLGNPNDCSASNPPRYYRVLQPVNNSDELTLLLWTYNGDSKLPNSCHKIPGAVGAWKDYIRFESLKVFIVFSDDDPTSYRASNVPDSCPQWGTGPIYGGCSNADCLSVTGTMQNCSTYCPNFGCPTYADAPADWGGADFPTELYRLPPMQTVHGAMENPFGSATNRRWVFHSIIGVQNTLEPSDPIAPRCTTCDFNGNTAQNAGPTYQALSRLTGGVRFSSCNTDYSPLFQRISSMLAPIACEFQLESTGLGTVDPANTNVVFYPDGVSNPQTIPQDSTHACDVDANGWQFVAGNTRIRVCGAACDQIQADPLARVEIQEGCASVFADGGTGGGDGGTGGGDGGTGGDGGDGGCRPEICGNGIDDDCDGLIDNQDLDCIYVPP